MRPSRLGKGALRRDLLDAATRCGAAILYDGGDVIIRHVRMVPPSVRLNNRRKDAGRAQVKSVNGLIQEVFGGFE